jgi:hypothetical protein
LPRAIPDVRKPTKDRSAATSRIAKLASLVGFNVVGGIVGPWLQGIFALELISGSFQPGANSAASTFAALSFLLAYAFSAKKSRATIETGARRAGIICALCLIACLSFRSLMHLIIVGRVLTYMLWVLWILVYVTVFSAFSATLGYLTRLVQSERK